MIKLNPISAPISALIYADAAHGNLANGASQGYLIL